MTFVLEAYNKRKIPAFHQRPPRFVPFASRRP